MKNAFITALNQLIASKNEIAAAFEGIKDTLFSSNTLETELEQKSEQFDTAVEMVKALIQQNARTAIDQKEYGRRYQEAVQTCEQLQIECDDLQQQIEAFSQRREDIAYFLKQLSAMKLITEFEPTLFITMIDEVIVEPDGSVVFSFIDGSVVDTHN